MISRNIALIGVGRWGQHVARNLIELNALKAYVNLTSVPELDDQGIEFISFEECLKRSDITAAWVATPSVYHFEQVSALLKANKSVMVEKPMALTLDQADSLQALADDRGIDLIVDYLLCYHPAVVYMKDKLALREYGQVRSIQIRRRNSIAIRDFETVWWDLGIHDLAWLYELWGLPFEDMRGLQCATYRADFIDQAVVLMRMGSIHVIHDISWSSPIKEASINIYTDRGMLQFNDLLPLDEKLCWYGRSDKNCMLSSKPHRIKLPSQQPLKMSCQHFIDVINSSSSAKTTHKKYRPVMVALEQFSNVSQKMMNIL